MSEHRSARTDGCVVVGGTAAAADADRAWLHEAIRKVEADANRSADTHLHVFPLPEDWGDRPLPQGRVASTRPAR